MRYSIVWAQDDVTYRFWQTLLGLQLASLIVFSATHAWSDMFLTLMSLVFTKLCLTHLQEP